MSAGDSLNVIVAGMVAGDPNQGGATWAVMQYVRGLRALGHDVHLIEPVDRIAPMSAEYFTRVCERFDLRDRAALLVRGRSETHGLSYERLSAAAADADLLLNVSGMLSDEALLEPIPTRVFLDLDPAFNQLWHSQEGIDMGLDAHNRFATVGLALGHSSCLVPTCGRDWITTLPPVHLPDWERAERITTAAFTAIGNWRGYGSVTWKGVQYGQKAHSYRDLFELPEQTSQDIVAALAIHPDEIPDRAALDRHGWTLVDPRVVAGDPDAYQAFVSGSVGELGVAKSGYVKSRCGWFSDRSACYLASGRPVIAQDTGFGDFIPTGAGLLPFTTVGDAAAALDGVASDYPAHSDAARAFAEEALDSNVVLGRLLERVA
jgi:hypothetical protein